MQLVGERERERGGVSMIGVEMEFLGRGDKLLHGYTR